jgi:hypothetical protein
MLIAVPKEAKLNWVEIGGQRMKTELPDRNIIGCASADCRSQVVTLDLGSRGPVDLLIAEQRYGLPPDGEKIAAARPKEAIASQSGDTVLILKKVTIR